MDGRRNHPSDDGTLLPSVMDHIFGNIRWESQFFIYNLEPALDATINFKSTVG